MDTRSTRIAAAGAPSAYGPTRYAVRDHDAHSAFVNVVAGTPSAPPTTLTAVANHFRASVATPDVAVAPQTGANSQNAENAAIVPDWASPTSSKSGTLRTSWQVSSLTHKPIQSLMAVTAWLMLILNGFALFGPWHVTNAEMADITTGNGKLTAVGTLFPNGMTFCVSFPPDNAAAGIRCANTNGLLSPPALFAEVGLAAACAIIFSLTLLSLVPAGVATGSIMLLRTSSAPASGMKRMRMIAVVSCMVASVLQIAAEIAVFVFMSHRVTPLGVAHAYGFESEVVPVTASGTYYAGFGVIATCGAVNALLAYSVYLFGEEGAIADAPKQPAAAAVTAPPTGAEGTAAV